MRRSLGPAAAVAAAGMLALAMQPVVAVPLPVVPWIVAGPETYEGIPLLVSGDVVVAPGGTLRLLGVEATVATVAWQPTITVMDGGRLILANGVDVVGGQTRPTTLAGLATTFTIAVQQGGALDVGGAVVRDARFVLGSAAVAVRNASITLNAGAMVVASGSTHVSGSVLSGATEDLVVVQGGSLTIEDSTLERAGRQGIRAGPGTSVVVRRSTMAATVGYAIRLEGASAVVEDSQIGPTGDYALYSAGAALSFRRNRVSSDCGLFLVAGTVGAIEQTEFATRDSGISLHYTGSVVVTASRFAGAADAGVRSWYSPVTIRSSSFVGNATGVAQSGGDPVDARGNWWGSPSGPNTPGADTTSGAVDVVPWLTAER